MPPMRIICLVAASLGCFWHLTLQSVVLNAGEKVPALTYENRLQPVADPRPILADFPEFVEPVRAAVRFEAPVLLDDAGADLEVRAWRFSYNVRGIVEVPSRVKFSETAVIVVHPWGIDDGQGWKSPEPAGVAFFCTPEKNQLYHQHVAGVLNPFLKSLRSRVALVAYSLPGIEDPIRKKIYRSLRSRPTPEERRQGKNELAEKLKSFSYRGAAVDAKLKLDTNRPVTDYFTKFRGLDASGHFNNDGFWDLPIPVVKGIEVAPDDVVIYDAEGYEPLREFLKSQGIRNVLLCGYATDMCVCSTTAGYENLAPDFNLFLVGDATLATFPANDTPRFATNAALSSASLNYFITQVSWIRPMANDKKNTKDTKSLQ